MSSISSHYYNGQLRHYLVQLMAVFAGLQVQVGKRDDNEPHLINVPIYSASKDRVVGAIKGENTQNKPIRLPAMSITLTNLELAPERRKGVPNHRRNAYMPQGGLFPDDISVVEQRMPVPYNAYFEVAIWASNTQQNHQILEQILMLFNPFIEIQTSDDPFDWTMLTKVELIGVRPEENVPPGTDRRIIQTALDFQVPIWLSVPADVHKRYVKEIYTRLGVVSQAAETNQQVIEELDAQGIPYELNFSLDDIDLD